MPESTLADVQRLVDQYIKVEFFRSVDSAGLPDRYLAMTESQFGAGPTVSAALAALLEKSEHVKGE